MRFNKKINLFTIAGLLFVSRSFSQSTPDNKYVLCDTSQINARLKLNAERITLLTKFNDTLQFIYNETEKRLDSLISYNNELIQQLTDRQMEIVKLKNAINDIMASKNTSAKTMAEARELIHGLNNKVSDLEAEVTR